MFVLVVIINTMYVSSIDWHDYDSKRTCESAMERVKKNLPKAEVYCEEK